MNKTRAGLTLAATLASLPAWADPTEIEQCQTISQPGSYKLVSNLTLTSPTPVCLPITANFVTIDLAGFTMAGQPAFPVFWGRRRYRPGMRPSASLCGTSRSQVLLTG
jgi:hypothetical protein